MKTKSRVILTGVVALIFACESEPPLTTGDANFLTYSVSEQTSLATFISAAERKIKLEVDHDADLTALVPDFQVDGNYTVLVNGVEQIPGVSRLDLTENVTYNLVDAAANTRTEWTVMTTPLKCRIVIDASHDGGVWWFPQSPSTGFDPASPHQGQAFAEMLRDKGFEVIELGRDRELSEEMFFGSYIVLRAGGFESYTPREVQVYATLLERGMNLAFFTDHKKYDPKDEIADLLGLKFQGVAFGAIQDFKPHQITAHLGSMYYIAGSAILDEDLNSDIEVLGRLGPEDYVDLNANDFRESNEPTGATVMGILNYPKSRIFFFGDMNAVEINTQPFIDNLVGWMGDCSGW